MEEGARWLVIAWSAGPPSRKRLPGDPEYKQSSDADIALARSAFLGIGEWSHMSARQIQVVSGQVAHAEVRAAERTKWCTR
jgi:hypothetical protein